MSEESEAAGTEPATDGDDVDVDGAQAPQADADSAAHAGGADSDGAANVLADEPERTGNHAVDRVLTSLDELRDKPIDEHVAVFERAHEQLRGALDGPRPPKP